LNRLQELVQELKQRELARNLSSISFVDERFPKQKELILDTARFQAWNCTRRGAKSTSFARKVLKKLHENPGHDAIYAALTLDSAKKILWKPLVEVLEANSVPYIGYEREGVIKLRNGTGDRGLSNCSTLSMFGVNSNYKEMAKILGQKISMVGIDEVGSMTIDMVELCYQKIKPALSDLQGELIILGTCENIPNTFFEKVIKGIEDMAALWKVHVWTTYDNPYMAKIHHQEMEDAKKINPNVVHASWFRTHYLNEWCSDDTKLIVKMMDHSSCDFKTLENYHYVLGVDLGFNDSCAYAVLAYSSRDPYGYVVTTSKHKGQDITDTANTIRNLMSKYPISRVVVDGANKQGVEEMRNRHRLPLDAADKQDKATFLKLMADDIKQGKIKLFPDTKQLKDEWAMLQWKDEYQDTEDERCENHLSDATLYAWRFIRNFMYRQPIEQPEYGTKQYMDDYAKQLQKRKAARHDY